MHAFLVDLENKPGELARVAEAVAARGVNITAVVGATCGSSGTVTLRTTDDEATRGALQEVGSSFREAELVEADLRDEPGSLARACRLLADAGINIEAVMATGRRGDSVTVGFVTSDPARARELLAAI